MSKASKCDKAVVEWLKQGNSITQLPDVLPVTFKGNAKQELIRQLQLGDKSTEELLLVFGNMQALNSAYKSVQRTGSIYKSNDTYSLTSPPKPSEAQVKRNYQERLFAKIIYDFHLNGKHPLVINNINYTGYECDLLAITKSLRPIEFETKLSRKDFYKDANKVKWRTSPTVWKHYYVMPNDIYSDDLLNKHPNAKSGILLIDKDRQLKQVAKAQVLADVHISVAQLFNIARLLSGRILRNLDHGV